MAADGYIDPDKNGLCTVSFIGGSHRIDVVTKFETVELTVTVDGEEDVPEPPDTRVSFVYDGDQSVSADNAIPGKYRFENIPKGKTGTIVVKKSGYREYRQEFTADGSTDEITIELTPSDAGGN